MSSWQRLPRIVTEGQQSQSYDAGGGASGSTNPRSEASLSSGTGSNANPSMGPPSHILPSLNTFRQLPPLRSPPSSAHASPAYFGQQRLRSTSESTAQSALYPYSSRQLHGTKSPPPLSMSRPPALMPSSTASKRGAGEVLPSLAAFDQASSTSSHPPPRKLHDLPTGRSQSKSMSSSLSASGLTFAQHPSYHHHQQQPPFFNSAGDRYGPLTRSPVAANPPPPPRFLQHTQQSPIPAPSNYYSPESYHSPSSSIYSSASTSAYSYPHGVPGSIGSRESSILEGEEGDLSARKLAKSHVPSACLNCKRAHLACDVTRPCRRCINLGKVDTCIDVQHKKRGRPRLRDREAAAAAAAAAAAIEKSASSSSHGSSAPSGMPSQHRHRSSISSPNLSSTTIRRSPHSESSMHISPADDAASLFSAATRSSKATTSSMSSLHSQPPRERSVSSGGALWPQHLRREQSSSTGMRFADARPTAATAATVSLILSTGLQCARCSTESHTVLGIAPSEIVERSLFDLVHPEETSRLEKLWLALIDPVGIQPQVVPASIETVMETSPAVLMAPAPGTIFAQDTMRLCHRSGVYDYFSVRLHLGGGFGADLYRPQTLSRAYIVASLTSAGSEAAHPDRELLRQAAWSRNTDSRHFITPMSAAYSPASSSFNQASSHSALQRLPHERRQDATEPTPRHTFGHSAAGSPERQGHHMQQTHEQISGSSHLSPKLGRDHDQALKQPPFYVQQSIDTPSHSDTRKRPRSTLTPSRPSMAFSTASTGSSVHRNTAHPVSSARPSYASTSAATSSSPFVYSTRSERGGILC